MLHSKVAMKGLGIGNKRLQQNIVDLFPGSPTYSRRMKPSRTRTHTCVLEKTAIYKVLTKSSDMTHITFCFFLYDKIIMIFTEMIDSPPSKTLAVHIQIN